MLRRVGHALKTSVRAGDSCFRYGGDEFCVILMNCRAEDAEERFLTRLTSSLDGLCNRMSVSCGVAQTGPDAYVDGIALIREADERMLASKLRAHQTDAAIKFASPSPSGHFDANDSGQQIERFAQTASNRR
jgi:diguanylate cyclase